jgi:hypothetical protein
MPINFLMKLVGFVYSSHGKVYQKNEIWPSECFNINQNHKVIWHSMTWALPTKFLKQFNFQCLLIEVSKNNMTINALISTKIR